MEHASGADTRRGTEPELATEPSPSRGEVVFTAAAGMGFVCALAAAAGAWVLITGPDRLVWAAASDAGSLATIVARTAALLASATLALVGG